MAWRCSGTSNLELINNLFRSGLIASERVKTAMLSVDRAHYAPSSPYTDSPQPIGHSATISAPHMHAHALESLLPYLHPGARVLDVGSGSGYLTHVLAELVSPGGVVVGVEHVQALVELAGANIRRSEAGRTLVEDEEKSVRFVKGDGRLGWDEGAPYDAIHVGAAAREVHDGLVAQLGSPGRMFIPVEDEGGGRGQHVWVVDKDKEGRVGRERLFGVSYVPLTDGPRP